MIKQISIPTNEAVNLVQALNISNGAIVSIQKIYGSEVKIFEQAAAPNRYSETYEILTAVTEFKNIVVNTASPIWSLSMYDTAKLSVSIE